MKFDTMSIKSFILIFGIINSFYLVCVYLRGFFLESDIPNLNGNLGVSMMSILVSFFILYLIYLIKLKKINLLVLIFIIITLLLLYGLCITIFNLLKGDLYGFLRITLSILFEAYVITFAIEKEKLKRISKLFNITLLWGFSTIFAFVIIGIFEKYLNYSLCKELNIIYIAVFFHSTNFIFLCYSKIVK